MSNITKFLFMLPIVMAQSSSSIVIHCVLPVLWMASYVHLIGHIEHVIPLQRVTSLCRRARLTPLLRHIGDVVLQTTVEAEST